MLIRALAPFSVVIPNKKKGKVNLPADRLRRLISQRSDYRIFIGVPFATPNAWATVTRLGNDSLDVQGIGTVCVSDVRAFAAAYPNGQVLDWEPCGLSLPEGLEGLSPTSRTDHDLLRLEDLELGRAYLQITYGPSAARPRERGSYATTLKNVSTERIRVHCFAGYRRDGEGWKLSTVTRQFYSAGEFQAWYGLGSSEWIEPGQVASDANNYGSPPVLWAYYCESASGRQFVAGEVLE